MRRKLATLIKGALIIPIDEDSPDYFKGDLLVEGDEIAAISCYPEQLTGDNLRVIDADNLIMMPGLVNTHGHAAMSLLRGYADDLPLIEWLEKKIWPVEARLQADDVYWGTMLSILEMIKGGTTTFTDMYFFMDQVAEAAAECKIRSVLARGMVAVSGNGAEILQDSEALIERWHGRENGRININLGPHAPYTCPPDFLTQVIEAAHRTERPMQIHLAETEKEVKDCLNEHGCTPVRLLDELGFFRLPVTAAHCVHLTDNDIELMAQRGVRVAHNPGSNLKLGSGVAPLAKLLRAGIKVGLGTDGAASNNNLDLLEEMRLASLLAKGITLDPTSVPARKALEMATVDGAETLFLDRVGRLKSGYKADLIGLRKDAPHMLPLHDPLAQLVYAASSADVEFVMIDGNILMEKGELTTLDEEKIKAEASRCARRLTGGSEQ